MNILSLCEAGMPVAMRSMSIWPVSLSLPTCIRQNTSSSIARLASSFVTSLESLTLADASAILTSASSCLADMGIALAARSSLTSLFLSWT